MDGMDEKEKMMATCPKADTVECVMSDKILEMHAAMLGSVDDPDHPGMCEQIRKITDRQTKHDLVSKIVLGNGEPGLVTRTKDIENTLASARKVVNWVLAGVGSILLASALTLIINTWYHIEQAKRGEPAIQQPVRPADKNKNKE